MGGIGYSTISDQGYASFIRELDKGAWKDIAIKKHDADDGVVKASLLSAPQPIVWKLRLTWSLRGLLAALGLADDETLARFDAEWDGAQRAWNLALLTAAEHEDAAHREAAGRLRKATTKGNGTAQNILGYDQEVDFGWKQAELTAKAPLADDVKLLKVESYLKRIARATDALAKGIGREPGKSRSKPRSKRIREALTVCSAAFNTVHDEIAWAIEHSPAGSADRAQLEAMLAPFLALLERYPTAKAAKGDGEAQSDEAQTDEPAGDEPADDEPDDDEPS